MTTLQTPEEIRAYVSGRLDARRRHLAQESARRDAEFQEWRRRQALEQRLRFALVSAAVLSSLAGIVAGLTWGDGVLTGLSSTVMLLSVGIAIQRGDR